MGAEVLGLSQIKTGMLAIALVIGVGTGSVLAGMMSGGKVELGLVPLGASIVTLGALSLYWVTGDVDPTNPATMPSVPYSTTSITMMVRLVAPRVLKMAVSYRR